MIEVHGAVQHVELAPQLWCIPFFPLAASVVVVYLGTTLGSATDREKKSTVQAAAKVALAGPVLALAMLAFYGASLFGKAPSERFFLVHLGNLLRIGQLDVNVDFALDPLAVTLGVVLTAISAATVALIARDAKESSWRLLARLDALVAAVLVLVLADNLILALVGWGAVGALSASLARPATALGARARRSSFVVARLGDGALVAATAVLFWSFGGVFSEGDYVPDLDARFAAVSNVSSTSTATRLTPQAKGFLTLTSYPGALVFADDSHTPLVNGDVAVRAPFVRQKIDGGVHTFRIHPGSGLDDSIVAHARFADNAEVAFILVGATTVFRELHDQLALVDDHGDSWRRDAVVSRRTIGRLGAVTFACLLFLLAAVGRGGIVPFETRLVDESAAADVPVAAFLRAVALATAVYLLARVSFLFDLSPVAGTVAAVVGAIGAVVAGLAACVSEPPRVFGHVASALFGVALVSVGAGSAIGAVVLAAVGALALTAAALASTVDISTGANVTRWSAAALAAAPIPGLGIFAASLRSVGAAFASERITRSTGIVTGLAAAVAGGLVSFAVWKCMYGAYKIPDEVETKSSRAASAKKNVKVSKRTARPAPTVATSDALVCRLALAFTIAALVAGIAAEVGDLHPFTTDHSSFA
ncbi:MAG: proton-conducting transporter membrane subunit, partial [Polyangiaceae bacterium]